MKKNIEKFDDFQFVVEPGQDLGLAHLNALAVAEREQVRLAELIPPQRIRGRLTRKQLVALRERIFENVEKHLPEILGLPSKK